MQCHSPGSAAGVAALQLVEGSVSTVQDVNVSKVQEILTGVFKQTIHVGTPPAPPAPAHTPLYFNVTGAGSVDWNGQVQTGINWYKLVQIGTKWYKMVQNGTKWCKMVQNAGCAVFF